MSSSTPPPAGGVAAAEVPPAGTSGPPGDSTALTLQTVVDQHRIICALQELVSTLKSRIAELEAGRAAAPGDADSAAELKLEVAALQQHCDDVERGRRELQAEYDQLQGELKTYRHLSDSNEEALRHDVLSLQEKRKAEGAMAAVVESSNRLTEDRLAAALVESAATAYERTRWKSLAMTMLNYMSPCARDAARSEMEAIESDMKDYRAGTRGPASFLPCVQQRQQLPVPLEAMTAVKVDLQVQHMWSRSHGQTATGLAAIPPAPPVKSPGMLSGSKKKNTASARGGSSKSRCLVPL